MSEVITFLKILKKEGYPNPKTSTYAKFVDFDLDNFLPDLFEEVGQNGVDDFARKAIAKISSPDGLKITWWDTNEYVYVKLTNIHYDEDETTTEVVVSTEWGPSRILTTDDDGNETYQSIQEIIDNSDMGQWGDIDDMVDGIKEKINTKVYKYCGFGTWFQ